MAQPDFKKMEANSKVYSWFWVLCLIRFFNQNDLILKKKKELSINLQVEPSNPQLRSEWCLITMSIWYLLIEAKQVHFCNEQVQIQVIKLAQSALKTLQDTFQWMAAIFYGKLQRAKAII